LLKFNEVKVYFLGTGTSQGIPVIGSHHSVCLSDNPKDKRLRVSVWVHSDDFSVVIDCGPDFRQQMLVSKCPRLDALMKDKSAVNKLLRENGEVAKNDKERREKVRNIIARAG
jgi:hypothetical protein